MAEAEHQNASLVELTTDIASAYVGANSVDANELPSLIKGIFAALAGVDATVAIPAEPQTPAVSIKRSITPDYLICLEDGLRFKSMKRHLQTKYGLSPEGYRAKWSLPRDYPMVAPTYAAARSNLAKKLGLGQGGRRAAKPKTARAKSAPKGRAGRA